MGEWNLITSSTVSAGLMLMFAVSVSLGYTYEQDVFAINSLYASLGSPPLPGWVSNGGDPCMESWQGIQCVNSNITGIVLNSANLGGVLGDKLGNFSSMITIDLSNNLIGGNIPYNLPPTIRNFFLSANQFSGNIPTSLSTLALLSDLSLNNNHLNGVLPDAFQSLNELVNLDLSFNNLSGQLPPSLGNLSSLTTLHMQNNQLSGTLDVLQDLPLQDLNIENNLFWGPVPVKLFNIPNFKKDGNPFNTTVLPSPPLPPSSPPPPHVEGPTSGGTHRNSTSDSPIQDGVKPKGSKKLQGTKIIAIVAAGVAILCIMVVLLIWGCCKHNQRVKKVDRTANRQEISTYRSPREKPRSTEKVPTVMKVGQNGKEHSIDMTRLEVTRRPQIVLNPIVPTKLPEVSSPASNLTPFTIASLQQYTNSFGQENLIREDTLGNVYEAVIPDGQRLTVKTLDKGLPMLQKDEDFHDLVLSISTLKHGSVTDLVGYCMEHGQRLLVYQYFSSKTLEDALHSDYELNKKLSWNGRMKIALGAARALEYLHEVCQPSIVHQNFKSSTILIDDKLNVRASNCGLTQLISSVSASQSSGYDAPEFVTLRRYTLQSDIYSFGVIMLELLTGRMPYDKLRPRGERYLARWAANQLHDLESLSRMVDPNLKGVYPEKSLSRFADIVSLCLELEPEFRPPMSEIVQKLLPLMQRMPE